MAENRTDIPEFWGVWASALDRPEVFASPDDAVKRAHEVARSYRGARVHLMQLVSVGMVNYSDLPTISEVTAQHKTPEGFE